MLTCRILPHTHLWWYAPEMPRPKRAPGRKKRATPVEDGAPLHRIMKPSLAFNPSKKWVRYVDLPSVDRGYITELYNLKAIGVRYGLTSETKIYWRKWILPEPYILATASNGNAHYWTRIQLCALDAVLRHMEANGFLTRRKTHHSLLDLIDEGCGFLAE